MIPPSPCTSPWRPAASTQGFLDRGCGRVRDVARTPLRADCHRASRGVGRRVHALRAHGASGAARTRQSRGTVADLQYYIWDSDLSGYLLADRIVRAADRGVRVRVMLDDQGIQGRDTAIARLSGHPNVEFRAFNPFRGRRNRLGDLLTDASRVHRRLHNKVMIADNAIAIVGGRNIADHYFGVHGESNCRDLDTVAVGPVVRDASAVFDDFSNSLL